MRLLFPLLALSACAIEPATPVSMTVRGFEPVDEEWIWRGAREWEQVGFEILPADADTAASIHVTIDAGAVSGSIGSADRNYDHVLIDVVEIYGRDDWEPQWLLMTTAGHEVGHILLDTPEHVQHGVMAGTAPFLSDEDVALACRVAARCY